MGVAAFYRWLVRRYPKVQTYVIEEKPTNINGIEIPVDATKPNPNGLEIDNFYLDMNGIVHPCCHPQFRPAPETEEDMMIEIFKCLDRVFNMVRPRKLVYMAIDGVAPRAKMNQQRSRRFRAAQEAEEKEKELAKIFEEVFSATGEKQPVPEKPWDSNCITPGTPFMDLLARSLRYYIVSKLNSDPAWKNVKVILSDASVPGEGEHKIMDYVRRQRMMPAHDPNTTHVLYGLDADLIMLSLATHEPHFKILREDVQWADMLGKPCRTCGKTGHFERSCRGAGQATPDVDPNDQPFVFANIDVLREYLEFELKPPTRLPFPFDLERAIDDWVFMCFFVGNDFLPHLPSLEIREGALEKLVEIWKEELPKSGGYITHNGDVDLYRVQPIMDKISALEDSTFKERKRQEEERERRKNREENKGRNKNPFSGEASLEAAADQMAAVAAANTKRELEANKHAKLSADAKNHDAATKIRQQLQHSTWSANADSNNKGESNIEHDDEEEVLVSGSTAAPIAATKRAHEDSGDSNEEMSVDEADGNKHGAKRARVDGSEPSADKSSDAKDEDEASSEPATGDGIGKEEEEEEDSEAPQKVKEQPAAVDNVRLYDDGYKERYYRLKFHLSSEDTKSISKIVEHYVRGLCWVLKYYYQGCASWSWYYPYHYAPLASDFVDVDTMDISFELSAPLRPYEQLMGVLPARSRNNLPKEFATLMTSPDSPIIDFYPTDFPLDLNGKKFLWQAVILLPFIDQQRLLGAVEKVYPKLSAEDLARNEPGHELVLVSSANLLYESLCDLYTTKDLAKEVALNPRLSGRMSGTVSCDPGFVPHTTYESPLRAEGKPDIEDDKSISAVFHQPQPTSLHTAVLLPGVRLPRRALTSIDFEFVRHGGRPRHRGGGPRHGNNRDFSFFYRQQGNDVYQDRGRGPRRYDEFGNQNAEYNNTYRPTGYNSGHRPSRPARPSHPGHPGGYSNARGGRGSGYAPAGPRPMAYQPFAGRPGATPIAVPSVPNSRGRGRGGNGGYRGGRYRGGPGAGAPHGGGYRGGYRGRGGH